MKAFYAVVLCGVVATLAFGENVLPLKRPTSGQTQKKAVDDKSLIGAPTAPGVKTEEIDASKPYIASLETYGSDRINPVVLKDLVGKDLDRWIDLGIQGDPRSLELEKRIIGKVLRKYGFVQADWSIVQYFEPGDLAIHLTLDVVEAKEAKQRMPFKKEPTKTLADPDNLLNRWMAYEDTALRLVETGALEPEAAKCPALHCPFGHKHAQLKKYESIFLKGVSTHWKTLIQILHQDKRPEHRASAAYLLAYHKDPKKVIEALSESIDDPHPLVRNNAMRVLGDIAEFHPEHVIPIRPLLPALDYPRVSDRSKAIYVVYLLVQNSDKAREVVLQSSVPSLLKMVASKQPDHRDLTHGILRKISGKDYASTDVQSWKNWWDRMGKTNAISFRK